jgi:23S rRNA pseudouridine1911/1915/1917 synthase
MTKTITLKVTQDESGQRLDSYIASSASGLTRSATAGLIESGLVIVDGAAAKKAGYKLRGRETIVISAPEAARSEVAPEDIPLDVIYEDDSIIVVNKPAGMVVHPGAGVTKGTLASALLFRAGMLSTLPGPDRPGIVHRLDRDTSGVMVAAKSDAAYLSLARQFKAHTTGRVYVALVWGEFDADEGVIDMPLGRSQSDRKKISTRARKTRSAVTRFRVLERFGFFTLLELRLETGRTHQVRVHLSAMSHPVVGDQVYGKRRVPHNVPKPIIDMLKCVKRQMLHAGSLAIDHPLGGVRMEWQAPMPPDMAALVKELEKRCG